MLTRIMWFAKIVAFGIVVPSTTRAQPATAQKPWMPIRPILGPQFCSNCLGLNPAMDQALYWKFRDSAIAGDADDAIVLEHQQKGLPGETPPLIHRMYASSASRANIEKLGPSAVKAAYGRNFKQKEVDSIHDWATKNYASGNITADQFELAMQTNTNTPRGGAGGFYDPETGKSIYPYRGSGDSLLDDQKLLTFFRNGAEARNADSNKVVPQAGLPASATAAEIAAYNKREQEYAQKNNSPIPTLTPASAERGPRPQVKPAAIGLSGAYYCDKKKTRLSFEKNYRKTFAVFQPIARELAKK